MIVFFTDFLHGIIPNYAIVILTFLVSIYRLLLVGAGIMQVYDLGWTLIGAVIAFIGFFFLWFVTKGKGMGFGDVKFVVPMALILGWPNIFVGLFISFLLGAAAGIILLMVGQKKFGQTIPFGPFLVIGTTIALIWGDELLNWYFSLLLS